MPWCGPCQRYFAPTALRADGTCPACGEEVEAAAAGRGCEPEQRAPWHFWAVVVAAVAYVAWRIVQLVAGAVGV
ncbi:MAG: hypothetical protein OXG47_01440 [bacterium]|nr:hypothetical protein [bacterium]